MINKNKYVSKLLIITIAGSLAFSCSKKEEVKEEKPAVVSENSIKLTDEQFKNAGITLGTPAQQDISDELKLSGIVDVPPQSSVVVTVHSGGYLRSSRPIEGMFVSKGQVLGTVQDNQFLQIQEDYLQAKAKIGYLQKDYNRQRELNKTKASSDKAVQSAQADYNSALAMIKVTEEKLRFMGINPSSVAKGNIVSSVNVYSPVSGYIKKVNVSVGQYVSPQEPLYEIVNPDNKHLVLTVFEKDIHKISQGMEVYAYTNNEPDKKYRLKVVLIGRDFSNDRSTEVHCDFVGDSGKILPGMYMNAAIKTTPQNSETISDEAVVDFEGKKYVFVETQPKTFKMTEIQTSVSENGKIALVELEKLKDKKIAVSGAYNLLMALKNQEE